MEFTFSGGGGLAEGLELGQGLGGLKGEGLGGVEGAVKLEGVGGIAGGLVGAGECQEEGWAGGRVGLR